jgi:hypothetical protein
MRLRRTRGWVLSPHRTLGAAGGTTSTDNGVLVCGRHHDRIHANGHDITKTDNGHYTIRKLRHTDPHWRGHPPRNRAGP